MQVTRTPPRKQQPAQVVNQREMRDHTLLFLGLLCLASIINVCHGVISVVEAHEEQCFYEEVPNGFPVNVMFQVTSGGFLDIDLKVFNIDNYSPPRTTTSRP